MLKKILIIVLMASAIFAQNSKLKVLLYTGDMFNPSSLTPFFEVKANSGATYDANNKVTEWQNTVSASYKFLQSDTSLSPTYSATGLTFDGTNDYLKITDANSGDFDFGTSDVSFEFWAISNEPAGGTSYGYPLSKFWIQPRWQIGFWDANLYFFISTASGDGGLRDAVTAPTAPASNGSWHHVVVVWDRDLGADLYIDGVLYESEHTTEWTNLSAVNVNSIAETVIGAVHSGGTYAQFFKGTIYLIRAYKSALTAANALSLYQYGRK